MAIPAIAPGARDDDLESTTEFVTPWVGDDVAEEMFPALVAVPDAVGEEVEVADGAMDELTTSAT
jgi:hypothetical protein